MIQENWGWRDSLLVRHLKYGNVLGLKNINPCYFYNNVYITELIITVSSLASSLSSVASKSSIIMISICFIYVICLLSRINLVLLFVLVSWFISRDLYNCFIVSRSSTPCGDYNYVLDQNKYRQTPYTCPWWRRTVWTEFNNRKKNDLS